MVGRDWVTQLSITSFFKWTKRARALFSFFFYYITTHAVTTSQKVCIYFFMSLYFTTLRSTSESIAYAALFNLKNKSF